MDVTSIASLSTAMAQSGLSQQVEMAVLKKAMQVQASSAMALIEALPQAPSPSPAHLGQRFSATA